MEPAKHQSDHDEPTNVTKDLKATPLQRNQEIIEILDDSDDDDRKLPANDGAQKATAGDHRDTTSCERNHDSSTDAPRLKKLKTDHSAIGNPNFCMLNPLPSPIRIFATRQDEESRGKQSASSHLDHRHIWTLREMLGIDGDLNEMIDFILISNFIVDFDFLLEEIPELLSIPNVVTIYGSQDNSTDRWKNYATKPDGSCSADFICRDPASPRQSTENPLKTQMNWGCHHTKLFLVGFASGRLRVIVHTANLRWSDVHLKTQGAFIQDFLPKASGADEESSSDFEETLSFYLKSYHYNRKRQWQNNNTNDTPPCTLVELIERYDFSSAKGVLVPSIPGFHKPRQKHVLGYFKVRQAILTKLKPPENKGRLASSPAPIVCQFSSIGSLSKPYLNTLWSAWDVVSVHHRTKSKDGHQNLRLVYPTVSEILRSVEGVAGGGSVPGREKNVQKPFLLPLYRKWSSNEDPLRKGGNVPHIKTYYQVNDKRDSMEWFVLSSHNLSKAAWGEVQNGQWGETFKIFHWELGVFIYPDILGKKKMVPAIPGRDYQDDEAEIPIPYKLNPESYDTNDRPWAVDSL